MYKILLSFLLVGFTSEALSLESKEPASRSILNGADFAQWLGSSLVIVAFIFVIAYVLKKTKLIRYVSKNITIKEQLALGPKERIVHVQVHGQDLLLGVTAHNINLICKLDHNFKEQLQQACAQDVRHDDVSPQQKH